RAIQTTLGVFEGRQVRLGQGAGNRLAGEAADPVLGGAGDVDDRGPDGRPPGGGLGGVLPGRQLAAGAEDAAVGPAVVGEQGDEVVVHGAWPPRGTRSNGAFGSEPGWMVEWYRMRTGLRRLAHRADGRNDQSQPRALHGLGGESLLAAVGLAAPAHVPRQAPRARRAPPAYAPAPWAPASPVASRTARRYATGTSRAGASRSSPKPWQSPLARWPSRSSRG